MSTRIAIHHRPDSFSDRWAARCAELGVEHERVNCYDCDIMSRLASADALLWHFAHTIPEDTLVAASIVKAAETMGLVVFPNTASSWHFDDKVAQKYLLDAVGAPRIGTYVFLQRDKALEWIESAEFPKVFKLARGAGSANVRLVRTRDEAIALVKRAFGAGFKPIPGYLSDATTRYRQFRKRGGRILTKLRRLPGELRKAIVVNRLIGRERGYAYFQDFLPGNVFDTRVTVIGDRAFAFTRNVRSGDFRASGSGGLCYDLARIKPDAVRIAFEVARKIGAQSMAFDFLVAPDGRYLIGELCYAYNAKAVYDCEGHWDSAMNWHPGHMWPEDAILEDLLESLKSRRG